MKSRIPLKAYLSLHFGAVAVLPVITIACLVWFFMVPAIQTRTGRQHQAMARSIAGHISAFLEGGSRQLTSLAGYLQNGISQHGPEMVGLLDAQCGNGEFFEALFVVDKADVTIQAVGLVESRRSERADFLGLDLSGRSFITPANGAAQVRWSKTFLSTVSSRMAVALTVPLTDGFITGEITLDKLSAFISLLPVESGFLTLVIDGQGLIVADSQQRRWGQVLNINHSAAMGAGDGRQADTTAFMLDGMQMVGRMVEMDAAGWNVLVAQPVRNAFQPLRETFVLIGLGLAIALGLALSISWFLAGNLTALFTSYAHRAESIARGRYRLQWPAARTREFSRLGQSLQRMAETISQREKALVDNEEQLKQLVANVPGVVYQYQADPSALESSSLTSVIRERTIELFGIDTERENFFTEFVACLPAEDQPRFVKSVKESLEAVKPWYYEGRYIKPSGEEIWFEGRSEPRQLGDETVYYGVLTDITRRKEMEASLRLAKFIFDKADIGIFLLGENGAIVNVNEEACRYLGYSREALCRMDVFAVDTTFTPEIWSTHMAELRSHGVKVIETFNRHKNGTVFPVQVIDNVMTFENKEFHVAFVQDITARKQTEKSLRLAQFIIDSANIGIYRIDSDSRIREVNQKAAELLGYTKEELEALSIRDIDTLVASESWTSNWRELVAQGSRTIERKHRKKDGSTIPVEIYSNFLAYEGQEYAIAFVQDITERRLAEKALRENEQLLTNILESMNEGLLVLDSDFKYTLFNRSLERMIDTPKEKAIGQIPWDVFPFLKDTPVEEKIKKTMIGESAGSSEIRLQLPNGRTVWNRDSFSPLKDEDGRVIGIVGVVSDITRQKQDEEELRRLRNYLTNIIDSMPSILVAVDSDGLVTQWNHQAAQTTGLSFEKARSQPLTRVLPHLADEMGRVRTSIRERRVINSPKSYRKLANETRFEEITIFPLVSNGVAGAVIRVDDVTERVRLEEMMIQSEKMLSVGGLAAGMAHEINNPLAGILQNASLLENRLLGDLPANQRAAESAGTSVSAIRRYMALRKLPGMIKNIQDSGKRAAIIVRNMLSFVRKSDRAVSSQKLGSLLDQTLELVRTDYNMKTHYDFKRIRIDREYDPAAPSVPCEASKLQQVFMNIFKNGAEAMTEAVVAPSFILRVLDDGAWVRVEIEDNGPGMDEATRRRIFEPFFTTKPVGQGTGLGLSVSYFIVTDDHGGEMGVQAVDGGGTCFVLRLPKAGKG